MQNFRMHVQLHDCEAAVKREVPLYSTLTFQLVRPSAEALAEASWKLCKA